MSVGESGFEKPPERYRRYSTNDRYIEIVDVDGFIGVRSIECDLDGGTWGLELEYAPGAKEKFEEIAEVLRVTYFSGIILPAGERMGSHPLWEQVLADLGFDYD